MVLISQLKRTYVKYSITTAHYVEGPDRFDEWYDLLQKKYPNVTTIYCNNNKLTSLNCPIVTEIGCNNNKLTYLNCPDAIIVNCQHNQLEELYCPNATSIWCYENPNLKIIDAPKLTYLKYDDNINTIIPFELDNLEVHNIYGELDYKTIVEQLVKKKPTKSARKI